MQSMAFFCLRICLDCSFGALSSSSTRKVIWLSFPPMMSAVISDTASRKLHTCVVIALSLQVILRLLIGESLKFFVILIGSFYWIDRPKMFRWTVHLLKMKVTLLKRKLQGSGQKGGEEQSGRRSTIIVSCVASVRCMFLQQSMYV